MRSSRPPMAVLPMETREDRIPIAPVGRMNMKIKLTPMVTNIMMGRTEGTFTGPSKVTAFFIEPICFSRGAQYIKISRMQ